MAATTATSNPRSGNTTPPTTATLSPRACPLSVDGSPRSGRHPSGFVKTASPSWNQIVRAAESQVSSVQPPVGIPSLASSAPPSVMGATVVPSNDQSCVAAEVGTSTEMESQSESSDCGNDNGAKKPAWKKPSNGSVESGPVMDAVSWPALSESTKVSPKMSSSDPLKILPDAPISLSQVPGAATPSSPLPSTPSSAPPKQVAGNANATSNHNHGRPGRQRSLKQRDGGGSTPANGGTSVHSGPGELSQSSSLRDHAHNNAHRESGQRNNGDYPHQRNSYKRGNGGQHSRGEGFNQNYGGRRDQDRGNHDWNHYRNNNGRDGPLQQRSVPRNFVRPPSQGPPPFTPGPILVPPHNIGFPEMPVYYLPHPTMQYYGHPPQMYFAAQVPDGDPQLLAKIAHQVDYYFSNENLIKDTYLRTNMDENGWVSAALIAGFKKVKALTDGRHETELVLKSLRAASNDLEVQGDKIRKRVDWERWVMPPAMRFPSTSVPGTQGPGHDSLAAGIQNMALDPRSGNADTVLKSSSGDASGDTRSPSYANRSAGF